MLYRLRDKTRRPINSCDAERSFPISIQFIRELSASTDRDDLLSIVARWLPRMLPTDRACLTLKRDAESLYVVAFKGNEYTPIDMSLPVAKTATGQAYLRREVWVTSDTRLDEPDLLDLQILSGK